MHDVDKMQTVAREDTWESTSNGEDNVHAQPAPSRLLGAGMPIPNKHIREGAHCCLPVADTQGSSQGSPRRIRLE